jgi:uncharacterized paraquat-inducible protein A
MSLHLFSTPVQCTRCGTVVDDPTTDRCPKCANLLKERRAPRRLAGVEARYGSLRVLLNAIRFIAVLVLLLGGLVFFATLGDDGQTPMETGMVLVGAIVIAVAMLALAGIFVLMMDMEENTRSSFRLQQLILEELELARGVDPAAIPEPVAPPPAGAA